MTRARSRHAPGVSSGGDKASIERLHKRRVRRVPQRFGPELESSSVSVRISDHWHDASPALLSRNTVQRGCAFHGTNSQLPDGKRLPMAQSRAGRPYLLDFPLGPGVVRWPGRNAGIKRGSPDRGRPALGGAKRRPPSDARPVGKALVPCQSAPRRTGLEASMEQMETSQRLAGCSFGVGGVPLWGKLKAPMKQMETAQRLLDCSFNVSGVPF